MSFHSFFKEIALGGIGAIFLASTLLFAEGTSANGNAERGATSAAQNVGNASGSVDVSNGGITRENSSFDPLSVPAETQGKSPSEARGNTVSPAANGSSLNASLVPAAGKPEAHRAYFFDYALPDFSQNAYSDAVPALFSAYEKNTGRNLSPRTKKKVALKIYTASGKGLATPPALTRAVRDELVRRGFAKENILIVDLSEKSLRKSGYLPPFRRGNDSWEGSPVLALDTGNFYNEKWFFDNPLPSREAYLPNATAWDDTANERKSFLPIPLLFEVDFWINLPVATDSAAVGVSGALANATLWNVSNQRRFLDNPSNAAVATVSIATIPEFKATFELTLLSLEKYQFIGGSTFNENYTASENHLWLSANPVIIDYLLWQRMNALRVKRGFDPILPEPVIFAMASKGSVSLGSCVNAEITLVKVPEEKK